mmetsp:Transcript_68453/g.135267  ORF Transcript_68453/g.135267 Transcript_68453/m.135267 type:complete len:204 (-) Transcript_68453:32-643(-)
MALVLAHCHVLRRRFTPSTVRRVLRVHASSSSSSSRAAGERAGSEENQENEDLYAVLGVARGSGQEKIKAGYRRLAKECHPDANPDDPVAAARFRKISHAYRTLLHVGLRRMHDLHLSRQEIHEKLLREEKEEQSKLGGRRLLLVAGTTTTVAGLLTFAWISILRSPTQFWIFFRTIPEWVPGKWKIAEFYSVCREAMTGSSP